MPWKESSPMDQRIKFVATALEGSFSFSSLCEAFEISRKTGYKWLARFEVEGYEGLKDQSRAPRNSTHQVSKETQKILIEARRLHPNWGPRKILAWLAHSDLEITLPSASTVGDLYKSKGLVKSNRRRVKPIPHPAPVVNAKTPNEVWATDFKGEFRLQNGKLCYPLTISDHKSRFILCCNGQDSNNYPQTRKAFERTFREYGLPNTILSDNGVPFSSPSGLSQLSVWWIKLGINPLRTQPGNPQQNGRHERMHKTLKQETTRPSSENMNQQQKKFDLFVNEYNFERPHEGLNNQTPSVLYRPSVRTIPKKLPEIEYSQAFERRLIGQNGEISWKSGKYFISKALEYEPVGLEEVDDGLWLVYFGPVRVGYLNERTKRFERTEKKI